VFVGRLVYQRLRQALLPDFRNLWTRDLDARVKDLQGGLTRLQTEVSELREAHRTMVVREWQLSRDELLNDLDRRLVVQAVSPHVRAAIQEAELCADPMPHIVVRDFLPSDFYDLLTRSIPPGETFPNRDPVKQDLEMSALDEAPALTRRVWRFFDEELIRDVVGPALVDRFRHALIERYVGIGNVQFAARAAAIPHSTVAGRILLRRPGYQLRPHLDPKRVAVTGLLHLARPGDSEAYGTQLFRVNQPFVASGMKTFFPEDAGLSCELSRTVPFRANQLLAFVNSGGAHGATLPEGASLRERYSYQFYVKPVDKALKDLLRMLPADARAAWGDWLESGG
jgi:hypothetical protein